MKFTEAKKILREQGYNITKMGLGQYKIWRVGRNEAQQLEILQWVLNAEDIKGGVYRAMSLAGRI